MAGWSRDLRLALRAIRTMPILAVVVIGSIAAGVGVNTAVFSWIQARVLKPIPAAARGGDFVLVEARAENGTYPGLSWLEYGDLRRRLTTFEELIAFRLAPLNLGASDFSERTYAMLVSGNYFSALGLRAAAGRLLTDADTAVPGDPPILVVSHRFWQTRLAGARDVVGTTLRANDRQFTIVGVAPEGFVGTVMGLTFDVWAPATAAPILIDGTRELVSREPRGYMAMGLPERGMSNAEASADVTRVMRELAHEYPETNRAVEGRVLPQWQSPRGPQQSLTAALVVLQAVMLLVLAVVAGNTTNLVLARASARQREAGVMVALGASRWRVVRLLLTENLLLAVTGSALGALLAVWATTAMRSVPLPSPEGLQVSFHTPIDFVSLAFALTLGVLSGVLIGLPSGLLLARTAPAEAFRSGGAAARRSTTRDAFLVLEVALAVVILVVAGRFLKGFSDTQSSDPGFRREGVLIATFDLRGRSQSVDPSVAIDFNARLLERLRESPFVESAAVATSVPLDIHGMPSRTFAVEGHARTDGQLDQALTNRVTAGYFRMMGIPIVAGTDFAGLRDRPPAPQAIVNETFVRRFVGDGDPLGRRLTSGGGTYTIVGVVRDSLYNAYGEPPTPFIYLSLADRPSSNGEIHARVRAGSEAALQPEIRRVVQELSPGLPVYNVRSLVDHVDKNLIFQRIPARMFVVLGPLLLALVGVGIYAVTAYAVNQRRREVGTRIALGATEGGVVRTLVSDTLRLVSYGFLAGLAAVILLVPGILSGGGSELMLVAGVAIVFLATATLATWIPAQRASLVDPIVVLKET